VVILLFYLFSEDTHLIKTFSNIIELKIIIFNSDGYLCEW